MPRPALVSTITSWPPAVSSATDAGVRPTRYSWTLISLGTPTRISSAPAFDQKRAAYSGLDELCRRCERFGPVLIRAPPCHIVRFRQGERKGTSDVSSDPDR